ncbi:MAG TPA: Uma2 family endonuclease, partial [Lacipirellulaceae bacterium]|nr:Uma2 family endonuclease [Lacipirellulaceae bacterium]
MSTAVRLITAEELFHLPAVDSQRCELIDGEIVPMTPPGGLHGYIGGQLVGRLFAYVQAHRLGAVVLAET